ncbi:hypothetical protein, partial [Palleronia sp.]|uniref:hypothetical protein n=1 Tax=Palleronia sp. TaxID=1940284 RepID=UPI0035C78CFC
MERAPVIRHRQTATGLALLLGLVLVFGFVAAYRIYKPSSTIEGIIWQPSNDYTTPKGAWHLLGAHTLMVQWLIVDDHVWTATEAEVLLPIDVDWLEVLSQPWAQSRIWGLAGRYSINMAR